MELRESDGEEEKTLLICCSGPLRLLSRSRHQRPLSRRDYLGNQHAMMWASEVRTRLDLPLHRCEGLLLLLLRRILPPYN